MVDTQYRHILHNTFSSSLHPTEHRHRVEIEGSVSLSFSDRRATLEMAAIFFKSPPKWWIQWHGVFGNTFSEIHAPQNIDIESKLKALHLLVSEIDALLCKWPPFCISGLQNGGYNGMMYPAIVFLKSTPQKTYI